MLPKPDNTSYEDAAAMVEGGLTALNFLQNKANTQKGRGLFEDKKNLSEFR